MAKARQPYRQLLLPFNPQRARTPKTRRAPPLSEVAELHSKADRMARGAYQQVMQMQRRGLFGQVTRVDQATLEWLRKNYFGYYIGRLEKLSRKKVTPENAASRLKALRKIARALKTKMDQYSLRYSD